MSITSVHYRMIHLGVCLLPSVGPSRFTHRQFAPATTPVLLSSFRVRPRPGVLPRPHATSNTVVQNKTPKRKPSDAYLSGALETAADAPIASPLRGVILSPLQDPDAREEIEEGVDGDERAGLAKRGSRRRALGRDKKGRRTVGSGGKRSASRNFPHNAHGEGQGAAEIQAVLDRAKDDGGVGSYTEEGSHGKGGVKSVCAGVRVGTGLSLYHKFAQGEAIVR